MRARPDTRTDRGAMWDAAVHETEQILARALTVLDERAAAERRAREERIEAWHRQVHAA